MQQFGPSLKQRFDQIIFENRMMQAGFAAFPYQVMKDKALSIGARLSYAFLLMYGWQEGSSFAGQTQMAESMGISDRHLRRFLTELKEVGYIRIERQDKRFNNVYVILDKPISKLKARPNVDKFKRDRTPVSARSGRP